MTEQLIYEDGKIKITSNVFYNGQGGQFVIPTIQGIRDLHTGKPVIGLIVGLGLVALASLGPSVLPVLTADSQKMLYGLGAMGVLAYLFSKDTYKILLSTPAGEVEAFSTKDEQQFKNVLICLKRALSTH